MTVCRCRLQRVLGGCVMMCALLSFLLHTLHNDGTMEEQRSSSALRQLASLLDLNSARERHNVQQKNSRNSPVLSHHIDSPDSQSVHQQQHSPELDNQGDNKLDKLDMQLDNELDDKLDSQLGHQLDKQLDKLESQLDKELDNRIDRQLDTHPSSQLRNQPGNQINNQPNNQRENQKDNQLNNQPKKLTVHPSKLDNENHPRKSNHGERPYNNTTRLSSASPCPRDTMNRQFQRQQLLNATCQRYPSLRAPMNFRKWVDSRSDRYIKKLAHHFLVSDKFKVLACVNLKAASTTWKLIFMNNTFPEPLSPDLNFVDYLMTYDNVEKRRTVRLEIYNVSDIRMRLKSYYRLVSVRHPFDKLMSVYKDKLRWDKWYMERLGSKILKWANDSSISEEKRKQGQGVTLQQFLQFIRAGVFDDTHWALQHRYCNPCRIPYHFIAKAETLDLDADFLLRHKFRGRSYNARQRSAWHNTSAVMARGQIQDFSLLSPQLLDDIYEMYRYDFELFGYSPDMHSPDKLGC